MLSKRSERYRLPPGKSLPNLAGNPDSSTNVGVCDPLRSRIATRLWHTNKQIERRYGHLWRLTTNVWIELCRAFENRCAYCGIESTAEALTVDHFDPLSRGGRHELSNILPACWPCNSKKGVKIIDVRPTPGAPIWSPLPRYDLDEPAPPAPLVPPTPEEWAAMTDGQRWIRVLDFPPPNRV